MKVKLAPERKVKQYIAPFTKSLDPKTNDFVITGFYTSDNTDKVGDVITREATVQAQKDFRQFPTLRLMHQPIPVGKVVAIGEDDGLQWNQLKARIVSDDVKKLVSEGVLTAMSVGIIVKEWEPVTNDNDDDWGWFFMGPMKITSYDLVEVSLVDSPANADARVTDFNKGREAQFQHQVTLFKALDVETRAKEDGSSEVQTLILSKEKFSTEAEAKDWITSHDFHASKVDETENTWRFRQFDPSECQENTFGTKDITDGVQAVFCVRQPSKANTPTVAKDGGNMEALIPGAITSAEEQPDETKADWSTEYKNNLPDSAFAVVEPTGEKEDGKTKPLSARHLPHHDEGGAVDEVHLNNALARCNQIMAVTDTISSEALREKAQKHLDGHKSKSVAAQVEKPMDENKPTEVVAEQPVEAKAEEPKVSDIAPLVEKMDAVLAAIQKMTELLTPKEPEAKPEEQKPVEEVKTAEPEKQAEIPVEVVKAEEPVKDDLKELNEMLNKTFGELMTEHNKSLDAKFATLKEEMQTWTKGYIEELRKSTVPGKAAMVPEEPEKEEEPKVPQNRRAKLLELANQIAQVKQS